MGAGMRRAFANKVDASEKSLVAYARSIGFGYAKAGFDWDGDLFLGQWVQPVDWKTPGKEKLTEKQAKLIATGFPLRFVSRPEQLEALKAELLRRVA